MATLALRNNWGADSNTQSSDIQGSLHALAEAARCIDTRVFELAPPARVRAELVPTLRMALDDALVVLGEVLARYDGTLAIGAADSGVFNRVFDGMVVDAGSTNPHQRVADVAFMARWEIERKRRAILEVGRGDDSRLIAECCSARRRIVKAASGVERVLSRVEGLPSVFLSLFQTERQCAIETRAAYHTFGLGVRAAATFWQDLDLERCLRSIGTLLAQLVGRPIYEELRIGDRRSLRSVQARLVDWLRSAQDVVEGRRLVSEIVAFASLLMEVNQRPVLIEHDCAVLDELLAALAEPANEQATFQRSLLTLRGRDPELDALIERRADLRPECWQDIARRTLAGLREQVADTPSSPVESRSFHE